MKTIYVDMIGDLFHYGHVEFLKNAKSLGDYLVVGVHSDETNKTYKRNSIIKMHERIKVIEACRYVDKVIPDAPLIITDKYIKDNNINLVCHAHKKNEHNKYIFMYEIPFKLGIFKRIDYTDTISTTKIINRIVERNN
jgi:cytidyltransferase-like protein